MHRFRPLILPALLLLAAHPSAATVSTGVAKWNARDWSGAVAEWVTPAARGDADALFNLGQAYKLGRGVSQNLDVAQDYYRRAAAKGHVGATANLGITLYQDGRKTEALAFLRDAADKGDFRAAYVLGIATFNGDGAPRNQTLGYAYMLRAREGGLPQADAQAARMATILSAAERGRGEAAAAALAAGEPVPVELISPGFRAPPPVQLASAASEDDAEADMRPAPAEKRPAPADKPAAKPAGKTADSKSSPADAPKPDTLKQEKAKLTKSDPKSKDGAEKPLTKAEKASAEKTKPDAGAGADAAADGWRVQLGAYANESAARTAWATLVSQSATILEGKKPVYSPKGRLVRLQVGPYPKKVTARDLCAKLSAAGRPCFVTEG